MQTGINDRLKDDIIFQVENITKYYKCEDEEDNIINIINFLKRKEDVGIKDVSFNIHKGHIVGIVGNKKCGKSTILKIISGMIKPTSGKILYKGSRLTGNQLREIVSYISKEQPNNQEYGCALFENVIHYACRHNKDRCEVVDRAERLLEDFGMEEYKYKEVIKLPSSVRSKMFIIRGLLSHKSVLCFDQPFTYIEEDYREVFVKYVKEYSAAGKTVIITSDDYSSLNGICDELIDL